MYIVAWILKVLFRIEYLRKYYFAFYKKIFKPYNLFKGVSSTCRYNGELRMKVDLDDWIQQKLAFFTIS